MSARRVLIAAVSCVLLTGCSTTEPTAPAPMATPQPSRVAPLMKDFMGINAHTIQFKPDLYSPVCRLVRDYHPLMWDVGGDTTRETKFPLSGQNIKWKDESGKWKSFDDTPNWQDIYSLWLDHGFEIDACVQFSDMSGWKNPAEDAYRYGKAFGSYFGPSGEAKLVTSVEMGNEPSASMSTEDYMVIFTNMAKGVREADPKLKILTATTRAGSADKWSFPVEIFKDHADLYDVLNVHTYSLIAGDPGRARSYPEDPSIDYQKAIVNTINWRNENAPGKEVWVTEFGYDASTKPAPTEGQWAGFKMVSDEVQAQWIVRSFLEFSALDVERAYLYWFNDNDTPTFHASSGITRFLTPKPSYWAMRHLYQNLGDYHFSRVVRKDVGQLHVYEYRNGNDVKDIVWVIWSPTGSQRETKFTVPLPGKVTKAQRMPLADGPAEELDAKNLTVTESPAYVWMKL